MSNPTPLEDPLGDYGRLVAATFAAELADLFHWIAGHRSSCLVKCDKRLVPWLCRELRGRLRQAQVQTAYIDGMGSSLTAVQRERMPEGLVEAMFYQLWAVVNRSKLRRVILLPHLDLLAAERRGLTRECCETMIHLAESQDRVWVGFCDTGLSLHGAVEKLFPRGFEVDAGKVPHYRPPVAGGPAAGDCGEPGAPVS